MTTTAVATGSRTMETAASPRRSLEELVDQLFEAMGFKVVCVAESAGRWRRDGESSVVGGCRRSLRCSGIWRGSTTWTKSRSGKLTGRS